MASLQSILEEWQLLIPLQRSLSAYAAERPHLGDKIAKAEEYLFSYRVKLNTRFKTCAGMACYSKQTIELHPELLKIGREAERNDTFLHEIAHVLAYGLYRHRGHGVHWRLIFKALGAKNPARCHHYNFLEGKERPYLYTCLDCGHEIPRTRPIHKRGTLHRYYHPPCLLKKNKGRYRFSDLGAG